MMKTIKKVISEDKEYLARYLIFFSGVVFGTSSLVLTGDDKLTMLNYYYQCMILIISFVLALYLVVLRDRNK